jgi:Fe2+ or Zn2+ uptake regulation protein
MKAQALFEKILRDNSYSITKARALIFQLLSGAGEPWPMHKLIEETKGSADRVSVYRTVELLEKLGIVQRIHIGWKYKLELSEVFLDHHHHMTCLSCGRVTPIKDELGFEATIERLGRANGFSLKSHQLEMQGYCDTCQS